MQTILERFIPPSLHGFEKAVTPAALAVLVAILDGLTSGHFRTGQMEIALVGFLAAAATFAVSNAPDGWRRFAKAIVPAALTAVGVLIHWLVTGDWGRAEWTAALTGLGAALVAYFVPTAPTAIALDALYADDDLPSDDVEFAGGPPTTNHDAPLPGEWTEAPPVQPSEIEHQARESNAPGQNVRLDGSLEDRP